VGGLPCHTSLTPTDPEGSKGGAFPCQVRYFGKRGKPVKKMRLVPAAKAFVIARKLQGAKGSTISVI
jgi:hypothetical protein